MGTQLCILPHSLDLVIVADFKFNAHFEITVDIRREKLNYEWVMKNMDVWFNGTDFNKICIFLVSDSFVSSASSVHRWVSYLYNKLKN